MSEPPMTLQSLIDTAMAKRRLTSTNALAKAGQKAGHQVTHTTLSQIRAGTYRSIPKRSTLEALAWLAGVPYETVHEAAGLGKPRPSFAEQVPDDADVLTPKQRAAAIGMIRALADAQRELEKALGIVAPEHMVETAHITDSDLDAALGLSRTDEDTGA